MKVQGSESSLELPFPGAKVPGSELTKEQKGQGAKDPGIELARDRKGHSVNWLGSELARVLLADSLRERIGPGAKRLGTIFPNPE